MGVLVGVGRGGATLLVFAVGVVIVEVLVGLRLGVSEFVGSGFGGSFVGEGSISTLATTLASGVGVSEI